MHQSMNNFPISFEDVLETFPDSSGKTLKARVRRLSHSIDLLWEMPSRPRAVSLFNIRLAKFFRGLNENNLFPDRFYLKAEHINEAEDAPDPNDARKCIYLDENRLEEGFGAIEHIITGDMPTGHAGELMRGLGIALLNFFVLHLLRKMDHIEYARGDLEFPINLYARVDNIISLRGKDWYRDCVLLDRFHALQVMMEIDGLNPDDVSKVMEITRILQNEVLRALVRKDYIIRLRIYELYHRVRPFILGARKLQGEEGAESRPTYDNLDLLLDYVCGLDEFPQMRQDRKAVVREKIERRLARAIGAPNGALGWHIYRGLRARGGRHKFRTEYLFQQLLADDAERLSVLNLIYRHKKAEVDRTHPDYRSLPDLTLEKYQSYFDQRLAYDRKTDRFVFAEKTIEIDLGASPA